MRDIGADEIYSFDDDISEDDIFNDLDWNVDGVINLYEFNGLSAAWLGHDPNDPAWQADPNLVNPNAAAIWKSVCNLDATGVSQYAIDTADLAAFCDEWLWQACWRENYLAYYSAMASGGEMMAMTVPMFETLSTILIAEADAYVPVNPYVDLSRAELARLAINASEIMDYIEAELENEPDNAEALIEGLEFLRSILSDIREVLQSHLDMKPRDLIQSDKQSIRRTGL